LPAQCLQRLQSPCMDLCHVPTTREKGWYLALMAPNVKGPNYAWLDPSRLYCHPQGLQDCTADLLQPFQGDPIDMVAGIDAMGFILGAAAAAVLQKGFLAIRKAGHLCVQTLAQPYTDYSGREKVMEVRTDAISPGEPAGCSHHGEGTLHRALSRSLCLPPGLRILLVDQWVETGGTMRAAIQLVERLGGVVAAPLPCPTGVAAICIEDSEGGRWIRERYKCAHCVPSGLQPCFDRHQ
ncbi:APT1 phosphoribosyltransferase, partial [Burhinus bistriatus]|nr:APT1 phosphoribosyltransferase [Burhinus bistriatus]